MRITGLRKRQYAASTAGDQVRPVLDMAGMTTSGKALLKVKWNAFFFTKGPDGFTDFNSVDIKQNGATTRMVSFIPGRYPAGKNQSSVDRSPPIASKPSDGHEQGEAIFAQIANLTGYYFNRGGHSGIA
jgi:hypothetical protein